MDTDNIGKWIRSKNDDGMIYMPTSLPPDSGTDSNAKYTIALVIKKSPSGTGTNGNGHKTSDLVFMTQVICPIGGVYMEVVMRQYTLPKHQLKQMDTFYLIVEQMLNLGPRMIHRLFLLIVLIKHIKLLILDYIGNIV